MSAKDIKEAKTATKSFLDELVKNRIEQLTISRDADPHGSEYNFSIEVQAQLDMQQLLKGADESFQAFSSPAKRDDPSKSKGLGTASAGPSVAGAALGSKASESVERRKADDRRLTSFARDAEEEDGSEDDGGVFGTMPTLTAQQSAGISNSAKNFSILAWDEKLLPSKWIQNCRTSIHTFFLSVKLCTELTKNTTVSNFLENWADLFSENVETDAMVSIVQSLDECEWLKLLDYLIMESVQKSLATLKVGLNLSIQTEYDNIMAQNAIGHSGSVFFAVTRKHIMRSQVVKGDENSKKILEHL